MSLPTRPDIDEFISLINKLADAKTDLATFEWEFEKSKAHNIKEALASSISNKSRAVDYVKVIGNNDKEEKYLDGLMSRIISKKRDITMLYGRVEAWKANKELYRSDSYHQVTGRFGGSILEVNDG